MVFLWQQRMFAKVLKCLVLLHTLLGSSQAFWWAPPPTTTTRTTTAEPPTVLKQIPLTYFRTYTYQPLAGHPFAFPFYGAHMQTPLLAGPRYEHFASNYGANKYAHMGSLLQPQEPLLTGRPQSSTSTAAPTTTTTTTTTTTPVPTTSTSSSTTTTTTAAPLPLPPPPAPSMMGGAPLPAYDGAYPTYNRRAYLGAPQYPYRPHYPYPYPEYSLYKSQPQQQPAYAPSGGAHIKFVPCMCPVTVSGNGLQPMSGGAAYMAQARTASSDDDDILADDDDEDDNDDDVALPADKTVAENPNRSKIVIEADAEQELVDAAAQAQRVARPLETAAVQLTSNKIDGEAQTDSETSV